MVDWQAVNLGLDILVKIVFLGVFAVSIYVLKNVDDLVKSAERSAESIENTAENLNRVVSFARLIPGIGNKKGDKK